APAVPRKSRRVVPAPSSPVICLGVSRIFVLLEKSRNRATSPPARGGAGISVVFRQVGFCGERPGHREPTVIIEACRIPWGSSTPWFRFSPFGPGATGVWPDQAPKWPPARFVERLLESPVS